MSTRWWTLVTWALVAASAVFWGLRLFVKPAPLVPQTAIAGNGPVARGDLTRLLGIDAPPPPAPVAAEPPPDNRFQLIGVVAAKSSAAAREGVALIAVDGKPARAYRVGAVVDGQTVVKSVAARGVALGPRDGAAVVNLSLAPLPPPTTGTLPPATDGATPAPAMPAGAMPMPPPGQLRPQVPVQAPAQAPMQMQAPRRVLPPPQAGQPANPGEGPGQVTGQGTSPS